MSCPLRASLAQGWVHTVRFCQVAHTGVPSRLREDMGRGLPLLSRLDAYRQ